MFVLGWYIISERGEKVEKEKGGRVKEKGVVQV
jgi:hypothetical protein